MEIQKMMKPLKGRLTEDIIAERMEIQKMMKPLKDRQKEIDEIIREELQVGMELQLDNYKVTLKEQSRRTVDGKRLEREKKEVYDQYVQTSVFDVIKIKKR